MRRRRFLGLAGAAVLDGRQRAAAGESPPAAPPSLRSAPLELTGGWDSSPKPAVARVVERVREVSLADVRLLSDRQPQRLRVDAHASGPPAIWLHADPPNTAWIIVDVGTAAWCQLAYQFGHELGHVLCNSWRRSDRPTPPSQWLEEALAEAFSLRGLGLLARSWERDPPFAGDLGYAKSIRRYRADLIAKYRAAAPPGPDLAACWHSHCRDFTHGKGDPLVLAVLAEMEGDPVCVEDLGALNRWPARSAVPADEYLLLWQKSCAELGALGQLPARLRAALGLG